MKLTLQPNEARTGFKTTEYTKALLSEWMKKYPAFELRPIVTESRQSRGYLYGAVVRDYCAWQYGIDPRERGKDDARKYLFMRDFNSEIVKDKKGFPVRVPQTSKGKVRELLDTYTRWAEENGAPIPNPELFKKYRDEYSMDLRWECFHDWLDDLGIASDAMPSSETFKQLDL